MSYLLPPPLTPTLQSGGMYKIISVANASVLTVSPEDGKTVCCSRDECFDNQMWIATSHDDKWILESLYKHGGKTVALNCSGKVELRTKLIGSEEGFGWDIKQGDRGGAEYQISARAGSRFMLDLCGDASKDVTEVELWWGNNGANQFWVFQQVPKPS